MKVLVLSKYSRKGASSRYRMFQYFPYLESKGVEITTEALFDDEYLDRLYSKKNRIFSILKCYLRRFVVLLTRRNFDVLWVEKELFPWVPWAIEKLFLKILDTPYVVDYDDAIFHQYDQHRMPLVRNLLGKKCDEVMNSAALVVGGNEYLASRAKQAGAREVTKIPTVVSGKVFFPNETLHQVPVIGWIGSMSTAVYLERLKPIILELSKKHSFKFRIVGATVNWPELPVECVPWSEAEEVKLVQSFDIGVMPLLDSPWERGKCGFKLIQYMGCGKPVVADPVGVNSEIVQNGENGYLVSKDLNWYSALEKLLLNQSLRHEMGKQGRIRFEKLYSLERWQGDLYRFFQAVGKH
jgi:glycosyltransferase involved in cell wall biosynthesis